MPVKSSKVLRQRSKIWRILSLSLSPSLPPSLSLTNYIQKRRWTKDIERWLASVSRHYFVVTWICRTVGPRRSRETTLEGWLRVLSRENPADDETLVYRTCGQRRERWTFGRLYRTREDEGVGGWRRGENWVGRG